MSNIKLRDKVIQGTQKNFMTTDKATQDGFINLTAKLGMGADNLMSASHYGATNFISRNRQELDMAYRGSWLVGRVVDAVAEDMTKDGVTFMSEMLPDKMQEMQVELSEKGVWHSLCNAIKWGRLYGGCIAVILTDGADYTKPLKMDAIGKDTFRGLMVLDRWMIQPSMGDLITEVCPKMGMPKYYEVISGIAHLPNTKIHHSRVLRFEGIELPYYQKLFENLWGLSVIERMLDRLVAFDSATQGVAQLLFKSHLRIIKVKGFREALAVGGKTEAAVVIPIGLTILDAEDEFETNTNTMSGMADLIIQFGTQVSGAVEIPIVRLFGQSPSGFSTGETDLRNYYDHIHREQENQLRPQLDVLFEVIGRSLFGKELPEDFEYDFNPLWTLSDTEKAAIATSDEASIGGAFGAGIITKTIALKELLQQSRVSGRFSNITDEDIEDAENEPVAPTGAENENPALNAKGEEGDLPDLSALSGKQSTEASLKTAKVGKGNNEAALEKVKKGEGTAAANESSESKATSEKTGGESEASLTKGKVETEAEKK